MVIHHKNLHPPILQDDVILLRSNGNVARFPTGQKNRTAKFFFHTLYSLFRDNFQRKYLGHHKEEENTF